MRRHADVLDRARGSNRRNVVREEAVGKVRLRQNQTRIMNERARLGDPNAYAIDADTALRLVMEDLNKL